jgi:uncharacterized protein YjiS (DUF1127 family)
MAPYIMIFSHAKAEKLSFVHRRRRGQIYRQIAWKWRAAMAYLSYPALIKYQPRPASLLARLRRLLRLWRRRIRDREALARLDERELRDIGMTRAALYDELRKPFWRA